MASTIKKPPRCAKNQVRFSSLAQLRKFRRSSASILIGTCALIISPHATECSRPTSNLDEQKFVFMLLYFLFFFYFSKNHLELCCHMYTLELTLLRRFHMRAKLIKRRESSNHFCALRRSSEEKAVLLDAQTDVIMNSDDNEIKLLSFAVVIQFKCWRSQLLHGPLSRSETIWFHMVFVFFPRVFLIKKILFLQLIYHEMV